jgi:hypothetical protein
VGARPVAVTGAAQLGGVLAEPGEVLFGMLGADDCFSGQHRDPSFRAQWFPDGWSSRLP